MGKARKPAKIFSKNKANHNKKVKRIQENAQLLKKLKAETCQTE